MVKKNEIAMVEIDIYLWKMRWCRGLRTLEECRRNAGETVMLEKWTVPVQICVWKEREEDVCGKKEGNEGRGKMGIFGVCGKK